MSQGRGIRSLGSELPRTTLIGIAVVVVTLVVVDVVLVALALARTAPEARGDAGPVPSFGSSAAAPATPSASASADPTADGVSTRHMLSAVDGLEAWRASSTSCDVSETVLEHTTDGGQAWSPVALGDDVRTIGSLRATADGLSVLVGVGDECATEVRTSTDDGATWVVGTAGAAGAGVTDQGLVLGDAVVPSPCEDPLDAFRGDSTTLVACADELQWRTGDGEWVVVPVDGVRALAVNGTEYTLARVGTDTCDGVQIETMPATGVTPETTTTPIGCNPVATDGAIALDRSGQDVWMWAGDSVAVSKDGGATW